MGQCGAGSPAYKGLWRGAHGNDAWKHGGDRLRRRVRVGDMRKTTMLTERAHQSVTQGAGERGGDVACAARAFGWLAGLAHERRRRERRGTDNAVLGHLLEWATGEGKERSGPRGKGAGRLGQKPRKDSGRKRNSFLIS